MRRISRVTRFARTFRAMNRTSYKIYGIRKYTLTTPRSTNAIPFKFEESFLNRYRGKDPKFGFNGLGELVYRRTYSRLDHQTGKKEEWEDTIERVVKGSMDMYYTHMEKERLRPWNRVVVNNIAETMYDKIWKKKFLPPGRGLWAMGTDLVNKKKLYTALNNCAFVSTKDLSKDKSKPFIFVMNASMLGVGVGYDTKGADTLLIHSPSMVKTQHYQIPDTREGWVESTRLLLESYFNPDMLSVVFDYSLIRKAGEPLKTFGGTSAGSAPLKELHERIRTILNKRVGGRLTSRDIVDIMNVEGKCVVAGNVRRSSQMALGEPGDSDFLDLKNYAKNPERVDFGWCSNNSVIADSDTNYEEIAERINNNGEPGVFWLDNVRDYGRMNSIVDGKDHRAMGTNPCGEMSLESYEPCNLVEVPISKNDNLSEFLASIELAFLYAKIVTLGVPDADEWPESNKVISRNRRIGTSLSGIYEFYYKHGKDKTIEWFDKGYQLIQKLDRIYSKAFGVPESIKTTTVKPSGTVSQLIGCTPGIHAPIKGPHYIRRVQMSELDPLIENMLDAGYNVEPCVATPNAVVVEIPVENNSKMPTQDEVSVQEQFELAWMTQRYWSDNQVSCTITFGEDEFDRVAPLLRESRNKLKSISLLPKNNTSYQQMPYEGISPVRYTELTKDIKPIVWGNGGKDSVPEKYCSNDTCSV